MTLKKFKTIDIFLIFALCFVTHFLYTWFPNSLFSIFFPVNESVWEHMKMLFTSILLITLSDCLAFKKWNIENNNTFASAFISSASSIPIFLLIYWPIYTQIGDNMILNITVLFITIYFSQIISYSVLKNVHLRHFGYISIIGIIVCYIIFSVLTYFPPENGLFYDKSENKYGINHYVI